MSMPPSSERGRILAVVRVGWAGFLLVWPRQAIVLLGGEDVPASRLVCRLLGGRHLTQGVAELLFWPRGRRVGSLVDILHAASAVAFGCRDPRWRRAALRDGVVAASFAIAGEVAGR
jgi:hypothetical protein